jgi:HEPN domain-containing protein
MGFVEIDDWGIYQRDGEQFLHVARSAWQQQKKAFSPETLYNLVCMAIEKIVMAFLMKNGDLADNHTIGDLRVALSRHLLLSGDLIQKLDYLDTFQEICDLETYKIQTPTKEDVDRFLAIADEIFGLLEPKLADAK